MLHLLQTPNIEDESYCMTEKKTFRRSYSDNRKLYIVIEDG